MLIKKIITLVLLFLSVNIYADYSLDSNNDGILDLWVKEIPSEGVLISTDTDFDGNIDSILKMDQNRESLYEETDYNLDGSMDNFYYYENGVVVRQEVDSNYDSRVDIWIYICNDGSSIYRYEKDTNFDGIVDKVKEFEVDKKNG
ncbi:MAG: hypothetical protein B6229_00750 [Spirochaetaceae bacterium 4572_7]|nr:MAG: hypothetical protein B6229_00750 [Spirochaetaceae bacterium 4572_7]